jgi:uncharacterized membrane protein required for colicin V production
MFYLNGLCAGWTNWLIDILLVIGVGVFSYICAKRGFIECFFGFVSVIAAFVVAILFSKIIISITGGLFGLQDALTGMFETALLKIEGFGVDISNDGLAAVLAKEHLPTFLSDIIIDRIGDPNLAVGTTLAMVVGQTFSRLVISFLAFALTFFAARFLMFLVKKILNKIAQKINLLGRVNMILGAVVGVVEAVLVVSAVLGVLALIPIPAITTYISDSLLLGTMYNHNIINVLLGWIIA